MTGARGLLGTDLVALLCRLGTEHVVALGRAALDVRDTAAVAATVAEHRPDVVVNCAAWTAVDDAETREDEALEINGRAVRGLAEACAEHGARLIQPSTDYVFDGSAHRPYGEDDWAGPIGAYGRTKLAGERAALAYGHTVVRSAWLYGAHGPNFVRTMMRLAAGRDTVSVVDDQVGQPTWTIDLAGQLVRLARAGAPPGIYHATSGGETTWCGFAREIFAALGADQARVRPVSTAEFPRPAPRPAYSVLGHGAWAKIGLTPIPHWRERFAAAWPDMSGVSGGGAQ
ncbi:MAG TPA: dTDP-4-dehydrorhamnose reductase [Thermopolyspora sp.]